MRSAPAGARPDLVIRCAACGNVIPELGYDDSRAMIGRASHMKNGEPVCSVKCLEEEEPGPFRARPCPCGSLSCRQWHVRPVAALQGVSFTKLQAKYVAEKLNEVQWP